MENCYCCSKDISQGEEKKRRHLLSSTGHVELLASLVEELDSEVDVGSFQSGYICRQCERKVKIYRERRGEIISLLTKAVPILPKRSTAQRLTRTSLLAEPSSSSTSPAVTASVYYPSRMKSYTLTPSRRRICKPLVRRSLYSFAIQSVKENNSTREAILKVIGQILHSEVASLCSDDFDSIMRRKGVDCLKNFDNIITVIFKEMKSKSPILLSLLQSCLKTRRPMQNTNLLTVVIISLLCKHRRPEVCLLQKVFSIILYVGHSSKLVFQRLQKAGMCLSHSSTLKLVGQLGEGFDIAVRQWKQDTEARITTMKDILQQQGATPGQCLTTSPSCPYAALSSSIDHETILTSPPSILYSSTPVSITVQENVASSFDVSMTSDSPRSSFLCPSQQDVTVQSSQPTVIDVHKVTAGFKMVFDNIDKTVKPRHMTQDRQSVSMHNVHAYAIKDRIDYSSFDSERDPEEETNLYSILPNSDDYVSLKERFRVHVSRIIVEHLKFFHLDFHYLVEKHIPHKFSKEMSQKSEVVPLGVLPKNETRYQDVIEILEEYKQYNPFQEVTLEEPPPDSDEVTDITYTPLLLGGDYLSVARVRGAKLIRGNSELEKHRLDSFVPCAEDWHCKLALLEVYWRRLFRTSSGMEPGTLYQLRNLLNRRNVTKKPKANVNAAEDFVEVITVGHILSAVMSMLKMSSMDGIPSSDEVSHDIWMENDSVRKQLLEHIATVIVDNHVDLATTFKDIKTSGSTTTYSYACEALTLGLFIMDFKDAVREGDGDRVLSLWKYMFLLFKASNRTNYSIEAFTLLSKYYLLLPPNIAEQLKWSRFVNVHGFPGTNVSCDLHMEHLNRLVKVAIEGLGANKSKKAINRASKALKVVTEVTESYDKKVKVLETSGKHADVSFKGDIQKIVEQLLECDTFNQSTCSTHASFSHLRRNLITTLEEKKVKVWMTEQFACNPKCQILLNMNIQKIQKMVINTPYLLNYYSLYKIQGKA